MSDSTHRFTGRVQDYQRYRQRYPAEQIVEHLHAWCDVQSEWIVADTGAGTGMLTEVFLRNGNRVIAIEPNAEMRQVCTSLRERWPELTVLDATAEDTKLPDESVNLIAAGRAFHWFDKNRALAEFRRIAKPGGWLVLVAQGRRHGMSQGEFSAQTRHFEQLLSRLGTDYGYVRSGYRVHENLHELFPPDARFHQAELEGTQTLDWESFRGQTMSLSMVPQASDPGHVEFLRELRLFFESYARAEVITIPTSCYITAAQL